jgi:hypothetical protein
VCLSACIIPHYPAPSCVQSATSLFLFLLGLLLICGKGLAGWVIMHGLLQSYSRCLQVLQLYRDSASCCSAALHAVQAVGGSAMHVAWPGACGVRGIYTRRRALFAAQTHVLHSALV